MENHKKTPISPIIKPADCIDNFGIVSVPGEENRICHVNRDFNYSDYYVEEGTLAGIKAYRVHPPLVKPKKNWLVSNHCIAFKINSK